MKLLIIGALLLLIGGSAWLASDCNNKTPYKIDEVSKMQSQFCMCSKSTIKVQGINESKCVTPHNDSELSCTNYNDCNPPERCIRRNESFVCGIVQAGCYDVMNIGNVVKKECL